MVTTVSFKDIKTVYGTISQAFLLMESNTPLQLSFNEDIYVVGGYRNEKNILKLDYDHWEVVATLRVSIYFLAKSYPPLN